MNKEIKEMFELYEKLADNPDLSILIKTLKEWYFEKEDYKSRIDKTIEYIEHYLKDIDNLDNVLINSILLKELLDILNKGE